MSTRAVRRAQGATQAEALRRNVKPLVFQRLVERPGQITFLSDLMEAVQKANGAARETSIQNAMSQLIEEGKPIEVETRGHAWVYRPNAKVKDKRVFEEIGTTSSGMVLVEGSDGKIYRLEEM